MAITHNICPYTLRPLSELKRPSDEHIFPDAIGGTKDYGVRTSAKENSDFGAKIEAPFIKSIDYLKVHHGIKSRSGKCQWTFTAKVDNPEQYVDVTIPHKGPIKICHKKPIVRNPDGTISVFASTSDAETVISTFIKNHEKKGRRVVLTSKSQGRFEFLEVYPKINRLSVVQTLIKIAYLVAYEYLGDAFLSDPRSEELRRALKSKNLQEIKANLRLISFNVRDLLDAFLPPLKHYEHAAVIAKLKSKKFFVIVTLFGQSKYSMATCISETSNYGKKTGAGKITICDARARKTRVIPFSKHVIKAANHVQKMNIH